MIAVLGSGSWASAIASIILENPEQTINWWIREPEIIEGMKDVGRNPLYLSSVEYDTSRINFYSNVKAAIRDSSDLVFVLPSAFLEKTLEGLKPADFADKKIHSAIKGLVPATGQIVTDYLHDRLDIDYDAMTVISGPSHAEEVAQEKLTYLTVASKNVDLAAQAADFIKCRYVHTVLSDDVQGIEYAAVMKNVYAIAVGICRGLGYGDNLLAVLVSNAMQEMDMFINSLHPMDSRQLERFSYLGDLLVTAYSQHSRNRTFGNMIGWGYSVHGAQLEMKMIAEGYFSVKSIEKICKKNNIELPIIEAVYKILYEDATPRRVMKKIVENFH